MMARTPCHHWACIDIMSIRDAAGRNQEAFMLHLDSVTRKDQPWHVGV
jgi:hypothetical protein